MRRRRVDLAERIDLLTRAVDLSEGRIPDDVVARGSWRCGTGRSALPNWRRPHRHCSCRSDGLREVLDV